MERPRILVPGLYLRTGIKALSYSADPFMVIRWKRRCMLEEEKRSRVESAKCGVRSVASVLRLVPAKPLRVNLADYVASVTWYSRVMFVSAELSGDFYILFKTIKLFFKNLNKIIR